MNREIKFRVFEPTLGMFLPTTDAWYQIKNGVIELPKDTVLMQFTGLKDKNGKEIYEGDIVAIENSGNWEVIFKLGSFEFFQGDKKISDGYGITPKWKIIDKHGYVEGFEIIGNIYQHPELLQQ